MGIRPTPVTRRRDGPIVHHPRHWPRIEIRGQWRETVPGRSGQETSVGTAPTMSFTETPSPGSDPTKGALGGKAKMPPSDPMSQ